MRGVRTHRALAVTAALFCLSQTQNQVAAQDAPQNKPEQTQCKAIPLLKINPKWPKRVEMSKKKSGPTVKFTIEKDGSVSQVSLIKSSGLKAIDAAALDAVKKSSYHSLGAGCDQIESKVNFTIDVQ